MVAQNGQLAKPNGKERREAWNSFFSRGTAGREAAQRPFRKRGSFLTSDVLLLRRHLVVVGGFHNSDFHILQTPEHTCRLNTIQAYMSRCQGALQLPALYPAAGWPLNS